MIEFGKTLREAREAKGYTISQIAETTHLKSSMVEQLENEDFSSIAAPIYGRGFVKLYCEAVGLDPKPLVAEFMAIMNGEHEIAIKERHVAEVPAPEAAIPPPVQPHLPPPSTTKPITVAEPDLFSQNEPSAPVPPPLQPQPQPPPPPVERIAEPPATPTLSRYASPVSERPIEHGIATFNPRIIILGGALLALLVAIVFGIRALYRATTPKAQDESAEVAAPAETKPAAPAETKPAAPVRPEEPAALPAANSKPRAQQQKIPALYID